MDGPGHLGQDHRHLQTEIERHEWHERRIRPPARSPRLPAAPRRHSAPSRPPSRPGRTGRSRGPDGTGRVGAQRGTSQLFVARGERRRRTRLERCRGVAVTAVFFPAVAARARCCAGGRRCRSASAPAGRVPSERIGVGRPPRRDEGHDVGAELVSRARPALARQEAGEALAAERGARLVERGPRNPEGRHRGGDRRTVDVDPPDQLVLDLHEIAGVEERGLLKSGSVTRSGRGLRVRCSRRAATFGSGRFRSAIDVK